MSEERVLTKEIAERFLHDEGSVDLGEYTYLEVAAAEALSGHERGLHLLNLTPQIPTEFEKIVEENKAFYRSELKRFERLGKSGELNDLDKGYLDFLRRARKLGALAKSPDVFNIS